MKAHFFMVILSLALALVLAVSGCSSEAEKHYNAGVELQEQGQLEEAIAEYDEAISLDPGFALAYCNRGVAYNDKNEFARAIADFDKAIELDPELARAYGNRAHSHMRAGSRCAAFDSAAPLVHQKKVYGFEVIVEVPEFRQSFEALWFTQRYDRSKFTTFCLSHSWQSSPMMIANAANSSSKSARISHKSRS